MNYIKKHSYDIVRLFLNQIAMAFFGLVLFFATGMANDGEVGVFSLVASIFSILFYLFILYATLNEMGMKDQIRVESGAIRKDAHHGLKLILLSQIPNFLFLLLMGIGWVLAYLFGLHTVGLNLYTVAQLVLHFLHAMYNGLIQFFIPAASTQSETLVLLLVYLLTPIPQILVAWGSYALGMKRQARFSE